MKKQDMWKPIRRGDRYCSPACGRGCTYAEYQNAKTQAKTHARLLTTCPTDIKNGTWKVRVWENLGWHWSITKGAVTLHCNGYGRHIVTVLLEKDLRSDDVEAIVDAIKQLRYVATVEKGPMLEIILPVSV